MMNDIRKILNIINEIDINSRQEQIDRIRTIYSDKIYKIHHSNEHITSDYTTPWIYVYSYEQYIKLQNEILDVYDIIHELSPESQLYKVLKTLHTYYCE